MTLIKKPLQTDYEEFTLNLMIYIIVRVKNITGSNFTLLRNVQAFAFSFTPQLLTCQVEGDESGVSRQKQLSSPVLHWRLQQGVPYLHRLYLLTEEWTNALNHSNYFGSRAHCIRQTSLGAAVVWSCRGKKTNKTGKIIISPLLCCACLDKWCLVHIWRKHLLCR